MAIITISRGSYSKGREIGEKVAQKLGYECLSREVMIRASEHFNVPEIKLAQALHDAPSVWERFTYGKERYLAYVESTLLEAAEKDNLVYHGLGGQFILKDIGHVLNVRILADLKDRVRLEMERENISREEALERLEKDDHERRGWSRAIWGVDNGDPRLYDLVIHIGKVTVDDAVELICHAVGREGFKKIPQSQKTLDDRLLAARVKVRLVSEIPGIRVTADDGAVNVDIEAPLIQEARITEEINAALNSMSGVKKLTVHVIPPGIDI
jgi:cytidylate kinase